MAETIEAFALGDASVASAKSESTRKVSVCVLAFSNISDDPQQEYFSDGISEDIITDLSKVSALGVTARNTSFQFKGKSVDVPTIARQLKVTHVLEGSVRKAAGRVRITAQLITLSETNSKYPSSLWLVMRRISNLGLLGTML